MNRIVESSKTLLVDGPASVMVVSGKVEVLGSLVSNTSKTIIREGKRLPFTVEEKATFDISLGENANVEEVDGSTIPDSWDKSFDALLKIQTTPVTVAVLGSVDSGKTSFSTYLTNRLLREKKRVAILDGDLGQSDIGPPCTVAYAFVKKQITDLFNLEAENAFFVGVTSPSSAVNKVIDGLAGLKEEILNNNPDFIIINTDGWTEGNDAADYKHQLVEKLNPSMVICIQQESELAPILNTLERFTSISVESPPAIKQRNREKRKNLRELGYIKYLRDAKVQSLPLSWIEIEDELFGLKRRYENVGHARKIYEILGMKPLHFAEFEDRICIIIGKKRWINEERIRKVAEFTNKKITLIKKGEEEDILVALYNAEKKFLGIGILKEVDYARKALKIFTPVSKEISAVVFGKVKLDKNLKEISTLDEYSQIDF